MAGGWPICRTHMGLPDHHNATHMSISPQHRTSEVIIHEAAIAMIAVVRARIGMCTSMSNMLDRSEERTADAGACASSGVWDGAESGSEG